jgi:hypothetical protein
MIILRYLLITLLLVTGAGKKNKPAAPKAEFNEEVMEFEAHWAFFGTAKASLRTYKTAFNNKQAVHALASWQPAGISSWFSSYQDIYESYYDPAGGRPYKSIHHWVDGAKDSKYFETNFNQTEKNYREVSGKPQKMGKNQFDVLSAFCALRRLDLSKFKTGDTLRIASVHNGLRYTLQFKMGTKEKVETILGDLDAYKFRAIDPKGILFPKKKEVELWLTADYKHLPVKATVSAFIGKTVIELTAYSDGKTNTNEKRLADKMD